MAMIKIKPASPKVRVRKENGHALAAAGEAVPATAYYRRRLRDGDVILVMEETAK